MENGKRARLENSTWNKEDSAPAGTHGTAAADRAFIPSVCPTQRKVSKPDLKPSYKMSEVHFSPVFLCSFASRYPPFQGRNVSLTVVSWLNTNCS